MSKSVTYAEAGVSIDANDRMVDMIRHHMNRTFGPRVISSHNGFAGLFRLDFDEKLFQRNYRRPVLVAGADGVGTKLKIALMARKFDTIGIDLVAMCVNDVIVAGAEPLFFLDYLAVDKLVPEKVTELVAGIAEGCRDANCALLGGETAEMPGLYAKNDFDMAGFAVGVVDRRKLVDAAAVDVGDTVIGLTSNGIHSNGYSLVRKLCFDIAHLKLDSRPKALGGATLGEVLLQPTRIYARPIVSLMNRYRVKRVVKAMAHITGGGLPGNIRRVVPDDCDVVVRRGAWKQPPIFAFLQKIGEMRRSEMFRVFNMGIGYVLVVSPAFTRSIMATLKRSGETPCVLGKIKRGKGRVLFN